MMKGNRPAPYSNSKENIGNLPLGSIDVCLTSPPYCDTRKHDHRAEKSEAVDKMADMLSVRSGDHHTPGRMRRIVSDYMGYSESRENIGNLPLGDVEAVDTIITSPPYENMVHCRGHSPLQEKLTEEKSLYMDEFGESKDNIGNLKSKDEEYQALVDSIITSPPYADIYSSSKAGKAIRTGETKIHSEKHLARPYTEDLNKDNIGNLPLGSVDVCITSPPYGNRLADAEVNDGDKQRMSYAQAGAVDERNIGRLPLKEVEKKGRSETYLEAMLKVYANMYAVLKPGGRAIVIVKPYIRDHKPVDLPYYTYILMKKVGFTLEKLYKLRLKTQSFWRILYHRRFPTAPKIAHEYVLVMQKPS
jgi:DNA modification methylase